MPALGERFRAAREARGLSLSDVAEQIRIRSVYLAAIEDENWSAIGAPVYVRGFLRTYGRFLGLDTEDIVAEFGGTSSEPAPPVVAASQKTTYVDDEPPPPRHLSPLLWVASLVAVALIAFVFYSALTMHRGQDTSVAALPSNTPTATAVASADVGLSPSPGASESPGTSASPGPSTEGSALPNASQSPVAEGPNTLEVRFTGLSWVRVAVDGSVSMEGTFPAGTVRRFHGKVAELRIGNAGGVEVTVDGKDVGPLGKVGDVVERRLTL